MRKQIIAGNWKMNMMSAEAQALVAGIIDNLKTNVPHVQVVLCPPFTQLTYVIAQCRGTHIAVGAQNCHWEKSGAFTGEIAAEMIKDLGCQYTIIGHSERRQFFGESDEMINKKVKAALRAGLIPILCVGERLEERESGITEDIVRKHVEDGFAGLTPAEAQQLVIAYEPVWAIGTGKTATPEQAQAVHAFIRRLLTTMYDADIANAICIQYGGSVNDKNVDSLMAQPDIDGALVGGASLKTDSFCRIIRFQ